MSDLTKWAQDYRGDWCKVDPDRPDYKQPHPSRQWVKAEEAEARIKELEAERNHFAELYEQATGRDGELEARTVDARLRAADELADAVEEMDLTGWYETHLTAYREAGK